MFHCIRDLVSGSIGGCAPEHGHATSIEIVKRTRLGEFEKRTRTHFASLNRKCYARIRTIQETSANHLDRMDVAKNVVRSTDIELTDNKDEAKRTFILQDRVSRM